MMWPFFHSSLLQYLFSAACVPLLRHFYDYNFKISMLINGSSWYMSAIGDDCLVLNLQLRSLNILNTARRKETKLVIVVRVLVTCHSSYLTAVMENSYSYRSLLAIISTCRVIYWHCFHGLWLEGPCFGDVFIYGKEMLLPVMAMAHQPGAFMDQCYSSSYTSTQSCNHLSPFFHLHLCEHFL